MHSIAAEKYEENSESYNFVMNFASYLQNIHFSSFVFTKMDFPIVVYHWILPIEIKIPADAVDIKKNAPEI